MTVALLPAKGKPQPPFVFGKVDLKLLEQCEALDRQFEKRALVYHDAALEKHLASLAAPLLPATALEHVQWKFHILRYPAVNAFALPNGSIYVDTGLLARAENDDQVAGTLAHEITHVTSRHAYLFNRSQRTKTVATDVGMVVAGGLAGLAAVYLLGSPAGNPDQTGITAAILGYGRNFEQEADRNALQCLKQAGRDPLQLVRLSLIIDDKLEPEPVSIWKDRSPTQDRIAYLKAQAGLDQDPGPGADGGYVDRFRAVILQNIQLDLDTRRFRSAVAGAQRLATTYPEDAMAAYWLGECYRSLGPREARPTQQTKEGQRDAYRQTVRRTEQEEADLIAATPEGKAALETNQQKAEEFLRKAAGFDPSLSEPYFGLGVLYEQQGKNKQAIEAYGKYIDLCREPADKERARRRVEELTKISPEGVK